MTDKYNRDPSEKQPGEKPEGTYHYNPGNQSGKSKAVSTDQSEPVVKEDAIDPRENPTRE